MVALQGTARILPSLHDEKKESLSMQHDFTPRSGRLGAWFSPRLIVGSAVVLAFVLLIVVVKNIHRERSFMEQTLLSQARILARSLEAGTRTGMMARMGWGRGQLQVLMDQMAQQPHVLFLRLMTPSGSLLASGLSREVAEEAFKDFSPPEGAVERETHALVTLEKQSVFLYARPYRPWLRGGAHGNDPCPVDGCDWPPAGRRGGHGRFHDLDRPPAGEQSILVVGLDAGPYESALQQDLRQNGLLMAVLFLVGAAGLTSLFWAHQYRLARRSLQDMEILTETILSRMPVGLVVVDESGMARRTNGAVLRLLGRAALEGSLWNLPGLGPIVARACRERSRVEEEVRLRGPNGRELSLLVSVTPLENPQGQIRLFLVLLSDITGLRKLEEKLRRSEHLASLGRLAAGVAHEIRNPLSSIKGFAAILAGKASGDPSAAEIARVFQNEVERLNRVVTELLEFARTPDLRPDTLEVRRLVDHTVRLVETDAAHARVSIHVEVDPPDLQLVADGDRLAQALLNLYLNAIQAMENGGDLTIRALRDGQAVVFSVEDTGPGIPQDLLGRIFDPYFTTKARGVGLGLAIVHRVVEAHHGEVIVESGTSSGTRFQIRLPRNGKDLSLGEGGEDVRPLSPDVPETHERQVMERDKP
jgi:two-component system sensor histidine kinase HydH